METTKYKHHRFRSFLAFALALCLCAMLPFAALACTAFNIPPQYDNTYYAALQLKCDRLEETQGNRIIVIGGSSTAFGIDSKIVEAELGVPCVNFGLYAAFGLKCMLDLSLDDLHHGDIVVIAPEFSSQMYSDYVGYSYLLQALDSQPKALTSLGREYYPGLLEALPTHISEKRGFLANGSPDPEGVYSIHAFDEYGDIIYDRPENIMDGMVSADNLPEIAPELVSNSFADMINDYAAAALLRGAQVYFSFCPVNALAVEQAENVDIDGFLSALEEKLECPILSSLEDHIIDAGYFYDSNFHMNNAGAIYNTILLVNDIKRIKGEMSLNNTQIPPPAAENVSSDVLSSGSFEGFLYDITEQGAVITGLVEAGMNAKTLVVPDSIEGFSVYKIGQQAFEGCTALSIEIPHSVSVLSAALFKDAPNLKSIALLSGRLPEVGDSLMSGAADGVKIYVPSQLYGDYLTDYFWTRYADYLSEKP